MAVKQNVQLVLPDLPREVAGDPARLADWWRQVKFALEQVVPQLISNVNDSIDGKARILALQPLAEAPTNLIEGNVAWADGVGWDPGAGAGLYEYVGGVWSKL